MENFPNMGKEIVIQIQEAQRSPIQDKSKEKHAKTHINQTITLVPRAFNIESKTWANKSRSLEPFCPLLFYFWLFLELPS